jgi:hypothetical protein
LTLLAPQIGMDIILWISLCDCNMKCSEQSYLWQSILNALMF